MAQEPFASFEKKLKKSFEIEDTEGAQELVSKVSTWCDERNLHWKQPDRVLAFLAGRIAKLKKEPKWEEFLDPISQWKPCGQVNSKKLKKQYDSADRGKADEADAGSAWANIAV